MQNSTIRKQANFGLAQDGARLFILRVYNYMAAALVFTGLIAYGVSTNEAALHMIYQTPLSYVVIFAPLGIALFMGFKLETLSVTTLQFLYWTYAALIGISLSFIFLLYTSSSIASVFFISASMFAATSVYGYTTKKDLTAFGSFLFMGVVGIIIATLVNGFFVESSQFGSIISFVAVLVFAGLAAYDNQKIKNMYTQAWSEELKEKVVIMGALTLYLDFINLFIHLLRLMGDRRQ
jgi:uncharacterized protein